MRNIQLRSQYNTIKNSIIVSMANKNSYQFRCYVHTIKIILPLLFCYTDYTLENFAARMAALIAIFG